MSEAATSRPFDTLRQMMEKTVKKAGGASKNRRTAEENAGCPRGADGEDLAKENLSCNDGRPSRGEDGRKSEGLCRPHAD